MIMSDFIDALCEAVQPRLKRNRRRLHEPWAIIVVKVVAWICGFVRAVPRRSVQVFRVFVPQRRERIRYHIRHSRKRVPGRKVIRIDDRHLLRLDMEPQVRHFVRHY